jgi:hypothetical protein
MPDQESAAFALPERLITYRATAKRRHDTAQSHKSEKSFPD